MGHLLYQDQDSLFASLQSMFFMQGHEFYAYCHQDITMQILLYSMTMACTKVFHISKHYCFFFSLLLLLSFFFVSAGASMSYPDLQVNQIC